MLLREMDCHCKGRAFSICCLANAATCYSVHKHYLGSRKHIHGDDFYTCLSCTRETCGI